MTSPADYTAPQVDTPSHSTWPRHVIAQPEYDSANGGGAPEPEVGGKNWNETNTAAYAGRPMEPGGGIWSSFPANVEPEQAQQTTYQDEFTASPAQEDASLSPQAAFPPPLPPPPPPPPPPVPPPVMPSTNLRTKAAPVKVYLAVVLAHAP